MSVGNRIRTLRRSLNLSQPELAKKACIGQSTISDLENDKKSTSAENMQALALVLKTTPYYLLTGNKLDVPQQINEEMYRLLDKDRGDDEGRIWHWYGDLSAHNNILNKSSDCDAGSSSFKIRHDEVHIKYFEEFPNSYDLDSFNKIVESHPISTTIRRKILLDRNINENSCIALHALDNSMYPTIKDGNIVYIDLSRNTIKDGKIFAIFHGGLFKFKRLYKLPLGGVRIVGDNAAEYPEEKLSLQQIIDQKFEVVGWAWSWQSIENW